MLEEKSAIKVEAPRFQDLRDLTDYILRRRNELLKELQILDKTLIILSKTLKINIDLNDNTTHDDYKEG